jgi:putative methionine-R-sulfoxide reductase with GAF domain
MTKMEKRLPPLSKVSFAAFRDWPLASKLLLLVLTPVGIVLIVILSLTVSGLNRLEADASANTLQEEVQIISHRLNEEQTNLQISAAQLASDSVLLNAVEGNDSAALQSSLLSATTRSGFDYLQILDKKGQSLDLIQSSDLTEAAADLKQLGKLGLLEIEAVKLVSTPHGWLLTIVRPIKTQSGLLGVLTAGRLLDASALTDLNFGRSNPRLVFFDTLGNISAVASSETPGSQADVFTVDPNLWTQALAGQPVFGKASMQGEVQRVAYAPLLIGDRTAAVFGLALSTAATTGLRNRLIITNLLVGGILAFLSVVITLILARNYISQPITALAASAKQVAAGNFDVLIPGATNRDEIGLLTEAFNNMTAKMRQSMDDLRRRAAEILTVSEVGTATATILETDKLLQEVVDLTKERFNLYHSHIYLLDEAGENLVLVSGAGEIGRQMVAEGRSIPLSREQSLVARAAREHKGVTVNDVTHAPDFLPNPLLPDTRSELAVPMIVGGKVIGVFDIQSDQVGRFTESDVNIQTTLASQVATSIQNVRSFEHSKSQADLESLVNAIGQKIQRTTTVEDTLQTAIREVGLALGAARVSANLQASRQHDGDKVSQN